MKSSLKKDSLSLSNVIFQGVAGSAPAGAAVATLTGSAAFALGSLPLSAVVAFIIVLINAVIINRISRHVAGAGGYYAYSREGIGNFAGIFTGWMYIMYQIMSLAFIGLSVAIFLPALLGTVFGIDIPFYSWVLLLILIMGFGYFVSFSGVRNSVRYAMVMATIEVVVVAAVSIIIITAKPSINTVSVFTPVYAVHGFTGVMLGVLFMYTAFSGFGTATPLGEEAKNANAVIGKGVLISAIVLGLFFTLVSYAFTVGWGPTRMLTYSTELVPGIILAKNYLGLAGAIVITVLFVNSLFTDSVVFTNSLSRVVFSMSRDNVLPGILSSVHSHRQTPHVAAGVMVIISFIIGVISVITLGGFNAFLFAGIAATLSALLVHMIANASLAGILHKMKLKMNIAMDVVLPAVSIVILAFVFYGSFISIDNVVIIASVSFIVWAIAGLIYSAISRKYLMHVQISQN
ncbi:APC family permease [Ferroplasma acidiphilum]|jgi:amino acid transporter|uniref:Amino acid permease n=3 Tax=Ferroplasma acidiphilum TaxID=74969 RepID=A0A1V0N5C0_9ARCH|nr:APC family permease [Ferroplasma acidiphilum]ARD85332.1 amino acid permease [Ferroplasma acidiphilum]MCL4348927.1 APC family permease [Candidatus Thermoplasmatota archaeon]